MNEERATARNDHDSFAIVGIGASAGGLEAFTSFIKAVPPASGMAYVLVQHLDPDHESLMAELLAKHTGMPVLLAENDQYVESEHVYVIPPNSVLTIEDGNLQLDVPDPRHGLRLPIDTFFESLASDRGARAIGVVLSGTGADGTRGLQAIRESGGLAIVQDPVEAAFDGMCRSAIAGGAADHVMAINDMPAALQSYVEQPYYASSEARLEPGERAREVLADVIVALKNRTLVSFDAYREGTLLRRIERRMGINHVLDGAAYLALLADDPVELDRLYADLLINVTGFFRDEATFQKLASAVLPEVLRDHPGDQPFRVWVAGCATGEEAYSLVMLLTEVSESLGRRLRIQLFATDLDEDALGIAREGVYTDTIEADVTSERLARFFVKEDHTYRVLPETREAVVFARHDLLSDPPFSRLDLVSCRNVLIYLDPAVQRRIVEVFHFGLRGGGTLLLGAAETVASEQGLFEAISREHRIYRRCGVGHSPVGASVGMRRAAGGRMLDFRPSSRLVVSPMAQDVARLAQKVLLERHAPAAVMLDHRFQGLFFSGAIDRFLKVPGGEAGQDVLAMVREGLRGELRAVVRAVLDSGSSMRSETALLERDGVSTPVAIQVDPVPGDSETLLLVTFSDVDGASDAQRLPTGGDRTVLDRLETELDNSRRELHVTIRDLEASNEELKAANEEAVSMNEEFQSTNEELETSREELQSLNEELTTLNSQLQQKLGENRDIVTDLNNLLNSVRIATIFLDEKLCIKRFTPSARALFNLIVSDVNRPLEDVRQKFEDPALLEDARQVLASRRSVSVEVRSDDGHWYVRRVLPYELASGAVAGVVITFHEVTDMKEGQRIALEAQAYAETIIDTVGQPLVVLDGSMTVTSGNRAFHELLDGNAADTAGRALFELEGGRWDAGGLREALSITASVGTPFEKLEIVSSGADNSQLTYLLSARRVERDGGQSVRVLLSIEDTTEQRIAERRIEEQNARLVSILESAQVAILTCDEQGTVESFSRTAERIFGYAAADVVGENVSFVLPDVSSIEMAGLGGDGSDTMDVVGREVLGQCKDGRQISLELALGEAQVQGARLYTAVMRDLTLEKKHQEELRQAQKMDAMGQLTGGVAHDFNNLLTVIIGNLEMLGNESDRAAHDQLLVEAGNAARMGAELTAGLLAFGRRTPMHLVTLDINKLVSRFVGILRRTLPESIVMQTDFHATTWPVRSDVAQLQNALLNLALNARSAMPEGGTLTISARNVMLDDTMAGAQADVTAGDYVALAVSDTGHGMSAEVQKHAFEPFYTTKDVGQGSGLGLSMIYGFTRQCGGHVSIRSETDEGSTITLFLPRSPDDPAAPLSSPTDTEQLRGTGEIVLVVEDDKMVSRLTQRRLRALGYDVLEVGTAAAALELLAERADVELLFSDVVLGGDMTGIELVAEARRQYPKLKVLLTSGFSADALDSELQGRELLSKPYTLETLSETLRRVLER